MGRYTKDVRKTDSPFQEPGFLVGIDMRRSENGWQRCKIKRVECLTDMRGLHWLDRRKAVDEVEDRGILHGGKEHFLEHETEKNTAKANQFHLKQWAFKCPQASNIATYTTFFNPNQMSLR